MKIPTRTVYREFLANLPIGEEVTLPLSDRQLVASAITRLHNTTRMEFKTTKQNEKTFLLKRLADRPEGE